MSLLKRKTALATFGKNWATFYSSIWSHCSRKNIALLVPDGARDPAVAASAQFINAFRDIVFYPLNWEMKLKATTSFDNLAIFHE